MRFCSWCGAAVNVKVPEGDNRERHVCTACEAIHYHNPRIITGCLPVYGEQVLLCRRAIEPQYGLWTVPAGFLELGETVAQGAARETWEEAGTTVTPAMPYCIYNLPHIGQVYMLHLAHLSAPDFAVSTSESLEVALFDEANIPWEQLAFRTMTRTLEHYFADRRSGQFPLHLEDILPLTTTRHQP